MPQPTRKKTVKSSQKPKKVGKKPAGIKKTKRKHQEYGTSKLEERFAKEFLDKLGVEYQYQYKAVTIGRYFDFRIMPHGPIIEIQGGYWHGDKRLYEEKDLNRTQKRNIKVDEYKKKWCQANGIKLIYLWEKDINETPLKVMEYLKKQLKRYIKQEKNIQ